MHKNLTTPTTSEHSPIVRVEPSLTCDRVYLDGRYAGYVWQYNGTALPHATGHWFVYVSGTRSAGLGYPGGCPTRADAVDALVDYLRNEERAR